MAASNSKKSAFEILNAINVNDHTEKKNGLTYLSWAWAWQEVKKAFPDASYTIYENAEGWNYFTDGRTCWVKTGVTIDGLEHIEYLPVMNYKNQSIPANAVTSFDVNKAIQRSLTKACARHGLGLYIYAGEDLPDAQEQEVPQKPQNAPQKAQAMRRQEFICQNCKKPVEDAEGHSAESIVANTKKKFNLVLCMPCAHEVQKYKNQKAQPKVEEPDVQLPFPIED